jgi:hypothetical protein
MRFWRKRDDQLQKEIDHYLRMAKQEELTKVCRNAMRRLRRAGN